VSGAIFVFGSNREGRHGAGAALHALCRYGAVYGQAEGLQGQSYAIVTKELRRGAPGVTLEEIAAGVRRFVAFARARPDLHFQVTPIGCGLAGFEDEEIAPLFEDAPSNVLLPMRFNDVLGQVRATLARQESAAGDRGRA